MNKPKEQKIANFNSYCFHDDTVLGVNIVPSTSRRRYSKVEIEFSEYCSGRPRHLILTGCANVSLIADFDVLTDNACFNTQGVQAFDDPQQIEKILSNQLEHLNIDYMTENDEPSDRHPTRKKLQDVSPYILFRVMFFGGTLEVVARNFIAKGPKLPSCLR